MSAAATWAPTGPIPGSSNPNETLARIEQNTAAIVTWLKYVVTAIVILIVLTAFLFA